MSTSTAHPPLGVAVVPNSNSLFVPPPFMLCPTAGCDSQVPSSTLTSTVTFPSYTSSPRPEELFTFNVPLPDPYACGDATFAWSYSGESQFFDIFVSPTDAPSANLTGFTKRATSDVTVARDVSTTDGSWTWLPVDVQQGWYTLTADGDTWSGTSPPFLVIDGPNVDCLSLTNTVPPSSSFVIPPATASSVPSHSFSSSSSPIPSTLSTSISSQLTTSITAFASSTTTSTSSSALTSASTLNATTSDAGTTYTRLNVGVIVGILGGTIGVALLAVIVYKLIRRRRRYTARYDLPTTDDTAGPPSGHVKWDPLSSSTSAAWSPVVDEKKLPPPYNPPSRPRRSLEPNRRPPSAMLLVSCVEAPALVLAPTPALAPPPALSSPSPTPVQSNARPRTRLSLNTNILPPPDAAAIPTGLSASIPQLQARTPRTRQSQRTWSIDTPFADTPAAMNYDFHRGSYASSAWLPGREETSPAPSSPASRMYLCRDDSDP